MTFSGQTAFSGGKKGLSFLSLALLASTSLGFIATFFGVLTGGGSLDGNISLDIHLAKLNVAMVWVQFLPSDLNDINITWRGWTLSARKQWALYTSIVLWAASLGSTTALPFFQSTFSEIIERYRIIWRVYHILLSASHFLPFMTNLVATLFVGYILWGNMKLIRTIGEEQHFVIPWLILLELLIESGAVYGVSQFLTSSITILPPLNDTEYGAFLLMSVTFYEVSLVYPIATIALIRRTFSIIRNWKPTLEIKITPDAPQDT
ncbi:hypothetical protein C0991_012120 [Blastosporella zonata]|nr:hypothetical protein C0991_012120 [Blastosporella zonata]